jgi:hypothetical protein
MIRCALLFKDSISGTAQRVKLLDSHTGLHAQTNQNTGLGRGPAAMTICALLLRRCAQVGGDGWGSYRWRADRNSQLAKSAFGTYHTKGRLARRPRSFLENAPARFQEEMNRGRLGDPALSCHRSGSFTMHHIDKANSIENI